MAPFPPLRQKTKKKKEKKKERILDPTRRGKSNDTIQLFKFLGYTRLVRLGSLSATKITNMKKNKMAISL